MTAILPDIPIDSIDSLEEQYRALEALRDALEIKMQALLNNASIASISNTAATVSGGYVQAEVQTIADDVETVSAKYDELLAILRTAGIIGA